MKWIRNNLGPIFLLLACPPMAILFWYTNTALSGSFQLLFERFTIDGFFSTLYEIWRPIFFGSRTAWAMIGCFAAVQLLFMKILPGKTVFGPETPNENIPRYKANGVPSFLLTLFLYLYAGAYLRLFPLTIIYDEFGPLIGALNFFSLIFCLFLYFKGTVSPSNTDQGTSGNFFFDYYWGTELYPRVLGWDVKMFTNCRFGMMSWALIILSFAAKQKQLYGLSDSMMVAVLLQLIYIGKFFLWEPGYLRSLDIMHDRAGFYICWGCLVWVPAVYTSPTAYLVNHPNHLGFPLAYTLLIVGTSAIVINYLADLQRQKIRLSRGDCMIWGKKPELTVANYTTKLGEKRESLLLASGWWGIARHFHYLPEIIGALCWSLPALFNNFFPYFYVVFLTILLFDRTTRIEKRCKEKYGQDWQKHCEKVRYRLIPFIY
jgi:7-dehydrocholesterol reductase